MSGSSRATRKSDLASATPWLVRIAPGEPLLDAWQRHGQGKSWGMMIEATLDLASLRKLLRRFLLVKLPDGEVVTFRFFDPRVFRGYIVTASPDELASWFNGVRQYAAEGEGEQQHSFRLRGGKLFDGDRPVAA